jgi:membrane complex biogenesis BtpA family protein
MLPKLIGVIHLPCLPGSPEASKLDPATALQRAGIWAVKEAQALAKAGFDGIIIENFGDAPFFKTQVGPETIASMAVIAAAIRESTKLKLGINVLRNDARSALAVAAVTGADFIRVNVLSGVTATDQGLIEGCAADLVRERIRLNAEHVFILADVHVKHAQSLSSKSIHLAIEETAARGGADGIIVSGSTTGRAPDAADLKEAIEGCAAMGVPLFIGSGATIDNVEMLVQNSVHIIVGSALRKGGKAGAPLDAKRMKAFVKAAKKRR